MRTALSTALALALLPIGAPSPASSRDERPSFVLVMADDQGWGDVGFRGHPVLRTPVLDELASTGLRLDRFYAAAPVCSPTRGSVLTGRHPNRFGCFSWGHALRPSEVTLAEALGGAGYATGHFGKWHVGSVRAGDPTSPGASGFDEWLSSPNFFENDPLLSHRGRVVQAKGESSAVVVEAALRFVRASVQREQPFLAVVWFGSPHRPHVATDELRAPYADQPPKLAHLYGELAGIDRAVGELRRGLRELGVADSTLLWYTSDNGALPEGSTGGLSGRKGDLGEGGLRVPALLEWPARIRAPRASALPCGTVDIYPTLLELAGARVAAQPPLDGISLVPLLDGTLRERARPLGFWVAPAKGIPTASDAILRALLAEQEGERSAPAARVPPAPRDLARDAAGALPGPAAWIDGAHKLRRRVARSGAATWSLFDVERDPAEARDLAGEQPERVERMRRELEAWQSEVARSYAGDDERR